MFNNIFNKSPVVYPRRLRNGSVSFSMLSLVLMAVAIYKSPEVLNNLYSQLWQPVLMVLWLAIASWLIDKAHLYGKRFEMRANKVMADKNIQHPLRQHSDWLSARQAFFSGVVFALLGLCIVLLMDSQWYWKLFWSCVICFTFYYAGYGLWGAWIVTKTVAVFANEASWKGVVNVYHGDKCCGLGFALRYSDVATIFMLTGISALPMAVMIVDESLNMDDSKGILITALVALAIGIWGVFSFISSIKGRGAISNALLERRDVLLDEIAFDKRRMIERDKNSNGLEALLAKEEAVLKIKTGLFSGAGAWKDFFTTGAVALTLLDIASKVKTLT